MPAVSVALEIRSLALGPIGTNCYLLRVPGADAVVVVDPGDEHERILEHLEGIGAGVAAILVTHGHWDHIGGVAGLAAATGAEVWMTADEAVALEDPDSVQRAGMPPVPAWRVDHRLEGGERIEVGGITFDVLSVPGHSPAHVAFLAPGVRDASGDGHDAAPVCCIGDVIFQGSIGRTDLPFSDPAVMAKTLRKLCTRLHPDTVLLPGHGGVTTMARELASNPFLQGI